MKKREYRTTMLVDLVIGVIFLNLEQKKTYKIGQEFQRMN